MNDPTPDTYVAALPDLSSRYPVGTSVEIRVVVPGESCEQFVMLDPHRDMATFAARFETEEP